VVILFVFTFMMSIVAISRFIVFLSAPVLTANMRFIDECSEFIFVFVPISCSDIAILCGSFVILLLVIPEVMALIVLGFDGTLRMVRVDTVHEHDE